MTSDVTALIRAALLAYGLTAEAPRECNDTKPTSQSEEERFSLPAFALAIAQGDSLSEEPDADEETPEEGQHV